MPPSPHAQRSPLESPEDLTLDTLVRDWQAWVDPQSTREDEQSFVEMIEERLATVGAAPSSVDQIDNGIAVEFELTLRQMLALPDWYPLDAILNLLGATYPGLGYSEGAANARAATRRRTVGARVEALPVLALAAPDFPAGLFRLASSATTPEAAAVALDAASPEQRAALTADDLLPLLDHRAFPVREAAMRAVTGLPNVVTDPPVQDPMPAERGPSLRSATRAGAGPRKAR